MLQSDAGTDAEYCLAEAPTTALLIPEDLSGQTSGDLASSPPRPGEPVQSSLPVDDAEIREIVEDFVTRLGPKIMEMKAAWATHDFPQLAELGHWLKGGGPTVGFEAFAIPAKALEMAAKASDLEAAYRHLNEIEDITSRICISNDSRGVVGLETPCGSDGYIESGVLK